MPTAIDVCAIGQRVRSGDMILRDISLTIAHGELVAIIGGSGAGKTTLLDAIESAAPWRAPDRLPCGSLCGDTRAAAGTADARIWLSRRVFVLIR